MACEALDLADVEAGLQEVGTERVAQDVGVGGGLTPAWRAIRASARLAWTLGAELRDRGVGLHVIEQGIDTSTAEGRAMFGMLSVLAEFQRELIIANTRDGLAAARARGRKGGRRPRLNAEQAALAQQLYDAGERTVQQIAELFGVPRTTVYGHLN